MQNATLDAFHQNRKDAVVIDDDMTLEDYAASYMKACPSNEVACFFGFDGLIPRNVCRLR